MTTMLIAQNETRESGSFMGDQLCSLRTAYLFAEHTPSIDHIIMSVSPGNEMAFLWSKFIETYNVELVYDNWNPGDWPSRWMAWDRWRTARQIDGKPFDVYKELYLRIHGAMRQTILCGSERGLGRRNIYQYWWCGQEGCPDELPQSVDWFDDSLIHHPPLTTERDVYISPHAKTQGNRVFTFDFWTDVVHRLVNGGVSVTVGYNGFFCEDLNSHPLYRKYWGDHRQWLSEVCRHKLVACGNTGTGWLAAACGVPMITMEPPNSQMPDHRYRQCGLRNIVEVVDTPDPNYVTRRIIEQVQGLPASTINPIKQASACDLVGLCQFAVIYSCNPLPKLIHLAREFLSIKDLPGDVADLGTCCGGTALILRRLAPNKVLHCFDTWKGTPYNDPLCHHKVGDWGAQLEDCQRLVGLDSHVVYHAGVFPETANEWGSGFPSIDKFCFVYIDMDTYQATRDAIDFFWPRMVIGGRIVFDDYDWVPCAGVKKAVDETTFDGIVRVDMNVCVVEKR